MMDREKANIKLKDLTWEELDWLEKKCQEYKATAKGPRLYRNKEATVALGEHFQSVFNKHHGY